MTETHEVSRLLERLQAEYGRAWQISTAGVGWQKRLQWRAERPFSQNAQVLRARTGEELEAALNFHRRLDDIRRGYGDTWLIGCQVKEEGVPKWAWAQRRERLVHSAVNAFSAASPEELGERLAEATHQARPGSVV